MKKSLLIFMVLLLLYLISFGAFEDLPVTGKSRGLGGSLSPRIEGVESIFYNPAGMFTAEKLSLSLAYSQPYGISDLNHSIIGINYKQGRYNFGLGIDQVSLSDVYTERKLIIASSIRLQRLYLGASINYYSISISGLDYSLTNSVEAELTEQISNATLTLGGIYRLKENLNLSIAVYDIGDVKFTHSSSDFEGAETELPMQVSVGGFYGFRDYVYVSAELRNSLDNFGFLDKSLRLGFEFVFYKSFALRLGNYRGDTTYGFGISSKKFNIDFALISNPDLGNNYLYSINLKF